MSEPRRDSLKADLGFSILLHGDPEDADLLSAAAEGAWDQVRAVLLGPPYRLESSVAESIVEDLRTGRTAP